MGGRVLTGDGFCKDSLLLAAQGDLGLSCPRVHLLTLPNLPKRLPAEASAVDA